MALVKLFVKNENLGEKKVSLYIPVLLLLLLAWHSFILFTSKSQLNMSSPSRLVTPPRGDIMPPFSVANFTDAPRDGEGEHMGRSI